MGRIPINIQKVKLKSTNNTERVSYLLTMREKNSYWDKTIICYREDLLKFKNEVDKILEDTSTAELLRISEEDAAKVEKAHKSDLLCKECRYKMTFSCLICLFELKSPLERKLYLALTDSNIRFQHQYGINWKGEPVLTKDRSYNDPQNNFKEVLTVADFFIEKRGVSLCVFTDGHTFHERTEEQAQHDRTIDRKLQEFGYHVLRYPGIEVNNNIDKIIAEIRKWIE